MAQTTESQQSPVGWTERPDDGAPMVELRNIRLVYGKQVVLDGIDLTVKRNEVVAVVGPSGTGKSTLVKIVAGLLIPDDGEVKLASDKIGLAFQQGALFSSMSVADNIAFVLEKTTELSDTEIEQRIDECLALVGLSEDKQKMPSELSGGMQKRVGIARALAIDPDIMLYDEPSAGLDPILASKLERDICRINTERRIATIVVTHEMPTIETLADRVVMLHEGKIVYQGSKEEFLTTRSPYPMQFRTRREEGPIDV